MGRKNKKTGDEGKLIRQADTSAAHASFSSQLLSNNPRVHIALIIFLILIVYSNSLNVPFQWDEEMHIVNNPVIKDLHYFINPSKLQGLRFIPSRYIPFLTFALNYRMNGLDVTGYHIVNNAIHIANTILVYLLVLLTFRTPFMSDSSLNRNSRYVALFSSLIFAAHPLQTAAVTYIMQRFASLVAFFYLLSLVAYIKARLALTTDNTAMKVRRCEDAKMSKIPTSQLLNFSTSGVLWLALSVLSAVLAMKTKENAFTLPLIIILYEFCFFSSPLPRVSESPSPRVLLFRRFLYLAPILLSLFIIPLTLISFTNIPWRTLLINPKLLVGPGSYMAGFTWDYSHREYFFTQFRVIVTYLRMLFFPVNLGLDYEYPVFRSFFEPQVMLSFIFLTALLGLGVYLVIKQVKVKVKTESLLAVSQPQPNPQPAFRLIGFGILWFFITLSVESIITTPRLIEIYRVYLPSVGAIISTVTGVFLLKEKVRSPKAGSVILVMLVIIIGALSVAAYLQNELYKEDKIRSWEGSVKRFPENASVHNNLGDVYEERNMYDKAMEQYLIAIKLKPDYATAHYNIGRLYQTRNMFDKTIEQYLIAIKLEPYYAEAHYNLGINYKSMGMFDKAIEQYLIAIKLKPSYVEAHNNLGNVYAELSMYDKAMEQYSIAIKLNPDNASAYNNLGTIYQSHKMPDKAIEQYLIAVKLKPDYAAPHFNLGVIYYNMGQKENAKREMMAGLKIMPDNQQARQLLNKISGLHPRADD